MTQPDAKPLTDTEEKILDAAIPTFVRYGARKTSMNDIAAVAGVSRQTIYDSFGGKDGVIRASIRKVTDANLACVEARLKQTSGLSDQLDAYFAETIVKSFELIQTAGDVEDLITGHNEAGKDEIARSHARHVALVERLLNPFATQLATHGLSPNQQASYIVTVAMGFKSGISQRAELDMMLHILRVNSLRVTGQ